jgi:hypothetical protein
VPLPVHIKATSRPVAEDGGAWVHACTQRGHSGLTLGVPSFFPFTNITHWNNQQ